ncbi:MULTISPECIES: protein translocase subunit SecF [Shewanella]|uniref:Protein-export membrane protein SecF n=1 Tax=Shewanella polaris TaxID=2588449 RepID=A0A4Y5YHA3_9GAMM|nr:protein translocase subunit SecF [Shewanella polaris]QDE32180.1 protein translocase subunit SecF [Shewanella polaris]
MNSNPLNNSSNQLQSFTKWRYTSSMISIVLMLFSLTVIGAKGFNWGLDFTGGVVTEVQLDKVITASEIQPLMTAAYQQEVSVISAGEAGRWVLRYADIPDENQRPELQAVLAPLNSDIKILNSSIVGPQVGQELVEQGGLALLIAMLCIMVYLSFRFEWRLASGALFALMHDVVFVLAFFALSQMEFNLTVLAAILAILGYSLNDSIIIADRIREQLIVKPQWNITDINNLAVKSTFSRTMVTSGTTLLTVVALWIMGGSPLEGFSIAMFIGILTGTWSSISVGATLPEFLGLKAEHYIVAPVPDTP